MCIYAHIGLIIFKMLCVYHIPQTCIYKYVDIHIYKLVLYAINRLEKTLSKFGRRQLQTTAVPCLLKVIHGPSQKCCSQWQLGDCGY